MIRLAVLAALALACLTSVASAAPSCVETGTVMRPSCMGQNFLAGIRSIKVKLHRVHRERHAAHIAISGKPAGCPSAWCGCFLQRYFGYASNALWQARKWASIGSNAGGPAPNVIAVWPHHVGLIKAVEGRRILLLSGNDGHRVRERWRTTAGIIAYRTAI